MSFQRGFKAYPYNYKYQASTATADRILFTCSKSAKMGVPKTKDRNDEKYYCPFSIIYDKIEINMEYYQHYFKELSMVSDELKLNERKILNSSGNFYFLQRFRSYHNHPMDFLILNSTLA